MKSNEEIIKKYIDVRRELVSEETIKKEKVVLNDLNRKIKKPFQKAKEDDIVSYLSSKNLKLSSKDSYKVVIIVFYKWLSKWEYGDKLPEQIRNIKSRSRRQKEKDKDIDYEKRIVTKENYNKLIQIAPNLKIKAIIETLYIFGIRRSELRSINADGIIEYDKPKWYIELKVRDSKTKPRIIPETEYPQYLISYWNQISFKNQKGKPLFYSKIDKETGEPIRYSKIALTKMIERLCIQANIKQHHTPHDFRHTAITRDRDKGMPDTHIETKYGFIHGSAQIKVYDNNSNKGLIKYLLKETEDKKQPETYDKIKKERDKLLEMTKEINELKKVILHMDSKYDDLLSDWGHLNFNIDELLGKKSKGKKIPDDFKLTKISNEERIRELIEDAKKFVEKK